MDKLVLDKDALERMGLHAKVIFLVEYDMHSEWTIPEDTPWDEAKWISKRNKLARKFRNGLVYVLKHKLFATQHLQSCWIVEAKYLDLAKAELRDLINRMTEQGFHDAHKRIRIVRVVTTPEDNEYYTMTQVNSLLDFISKGLGSCDRAEKEGKLTKGVFSSINMTCKTVSIAKEAVRGHKLYGEIEERLAALKKRFEEIKPLKVKDEDDED